MLKINKSIDKLTFGKNNSSRPAFNKNNSSKPASGRKNGNGKFNKFSVGNDNIEYAKKLGKSKAPKLFKLRKSKSEKLAKS